MNKTLVWPFALVAAGSLGLLGCSDAADDGGEEVVFEDDFDAENGQAGELNYSGFTHWDVVAGTVDLIGNDYYDYQPGNGLYVDLDGSTTASGTLTTKRQLPLESGEYRLSFVLAGPTFGGADTVTVSLGTAYAEDIPMDPAEPFQVFERFIDVASAYSGRLTFVTSGGDNEGILLDDVSLRKIAAP